LACCFGGGSSSQPTSASATVSAQRAVAPPNLPRRGCWTIVIDLTIVTSFFARSSFEVTSA
jgi:hypothetical protein